MDEEANTNQLDTEEQPVDISSSRNGRGNSKKTGPVERWLEGALADGFVLRHPVRITVWGEGFDVIADSDVLNVHAFGRDEPSAIQMLKHEIVERYRLFDSLGERLSDAARAEVEQYRRLILAPDA